MPRPWRSGVPMKEGEEISVFAMEEEGGGRELVEVVEGHMEVVMRESGECG